MSGLATTRALVASADAASPNLPFCHSYPTKHPLSLHFIFIKIKCPLLLSRNKTPSSFPSPPSSRSVRSSVSASSTSPMSASTPTSAEPKPFSVLFVCLGNICRSPAAEAVFTGLVSKRGLDSKFKIDSAGTIGYHEGDPADGRMRSAAKRRGVEVTSISRAIKPSDFRDFDLILAMDRQNYEDILSAYERWRFKEVLPEDGPKKVKLMCSYCKKHTESEVPDPYYGGPKGFEKVLDLLEDACESLLDSIVTENSQISVVG